MFGKKLVKGFLVDTNGVLVKEFLFSSKAEVTFDQIRTGFQGKGNLATLGAFEVGRFVATVVKGDKLHFIAVGRDVLEDEDVTFLKELLSSVEKSFDASLESKLRYRQTPSSMAKEEQEKAKDAIDAMDSEKAELGPGGRRAGEPQDRARPAPDGDREVAGRAQGVRGPGQRQAFSQINERVTLLLESASRRSYATSRRSRRPSRRSAGS